MPKGVKTRGRPGGVPAADLRGQVFGRLTARETVPKPQHAFEDKGGAWWRCDCDGPEGLCKRSHVTRGNSLIHGGTRSCGCLRKENSRSVGLANRGKQRPRPPAGA